MNIYNIYIYKKKNYYIRVVYYMASESHTFSWVLWWASRLFDATFKHVCMF